MNVFFYSTAYHRSYTESLPEPLLVKPLSRKSRGVFFRLYDFLIALCVATRHSKCHIYLPRMGTVEVVVMYRLFGHRITLTSDGLSDCLPANGAKLKTLRSYIISSPVESKYSVAEIKHQPKDILFDSHGPVALFDKRGRDPDYVAEFVFSHTCDVRVVRNPSAGSFSKIYSPASTLLFELPKILMPYIFVVSCSFDSTLDNKRRAILLEYEKYLEDLGFNVLAPREFVK